MSKCTVLTANAGYLVQVHANQAWYLFYTDIRDLNTSVPASLWSANPIATGGTWPTPSNLHGVGSPEGVAGAPIGSTYVRNDAYPGAYPVIYTKIVGQNTNTGWTMPGLQHAVVFKTANYSLVHADDVVIANGAGLTITLPAAGLFPGRVFTVKNINASACTVNTGFGTIDGAVSVSLAQWAVGRFLDTGSSTWLAL